MAAIETARPVAAPALGNVIARIVADVTAWNDARKTRQALSHLSDRELEDIGLVRGDIARIAINH